MCPIGMIFSPPCIEVLHFAKIILLLLLNERNYATNKSLWNWKEISKLWFHSKDNKEQRISKKDHKIKGKGD